MTDSPAALVLDTNVVLDWLVFRDPSAAALERALGGGAWRWHATSDMRIELEQVLTYEALSAWSPDRAAVLSHWERWAIPVLPVPRPLTQPLRCTDPDDQKFLDLALQLGRCTLLSRDRAVLKLARRAAPLGVSILSPERWQP
jgi:predicted nucleic acid-binding protein